MTNYATRPVVIAYCSRATGLTEEGNLTALTVPSMHSARHCLLQVFTQYREHAVLMWRGFTIQQMAHQVIHIEQLTGRLTLLMNICGMTVTCLSYPM